MLGWVRVHYLILLLNVPYITEKYFGILRDMFKSNSKVTDINPPPNSSKLEAFAILQSQNLEMLAKVLLLSRVVNNIGDGKFLAFIQLWTIFHI